jgi:hypothetical protein
VSCWVGLWLDFHVGVSPHIRAEQVTCGSAGLLFTVLAIEEDDPEVQSVHSGELGPGLNRHLTVSHSEASADSQRSGEVHSW